MVHCDRGRSSLVKFDLSGQINLTFLVKAGAVLVHCNRGRSRSCAVVVCYLIARSAVFRVQVEALGLRV